jgi:DNA repair protein RadD
MKLRDYQQQTIDDLYKWFEAGNKGNPCLVMPTGSGKSHIIAALCKNALQEWPETQILMLTHVKELIEQNAEKLRQHWPSAPLGIYSASMGSKQLGEPITFAGIQSVSKKGGLLGHQDLVIIDECHLVNHKAEGGYRTLLSTLYKTNPKLRVIGLTATPFRLGHGLITDKPAIFDALIEPIGIEELIAKKFLAPLRSKGTKVKLDTAEVHKRGGEFIESELQAAVDTPKNNLSIVEEVISLSGERKAWLFFCAGVDHAHNVADQLNEHGIVASCVTGTTPKHEREQILADFKAGKIRALTNANVLTTGFDYPDIDMIAMLRPTMSPGLYVQMAGRGLRPKSHTDHCLVLDFAGVVATHGPITNVQPPKKAGEGNGEAPVKVCPQCDELCHCAVKVCPACGWTFEVLPPAKLELRDDDIMGLQGTDMEITRWQWRKHISYTSGNEMLAVTYYGCLSDPTITEYFAVLNSGYAGEKARNTLASIMSKANAKWIPVESGGLEEFSAGMNISQPPASIEFKRDGKFHRVINRKWIHDTHPNRTRGTARTGALDQARL